MGSLFYKLGKSAGPTLRRGNWIWQTLAGSETDEIAAEEQVGRDLVREMQSSLTADDDPRSCQFVAELGGALAGCVKQQSRHFAFAVIAGGEANAFALPGGFIFITRPLLELSDFNRDETAFILGHEMAHVLEQHALQRIAGDLTIGTAVRALKLGTVLGPWLKATGVHLLQSAYSQDAELAADKRGAKLARVAGFDPQAAVRMLQRLKEATGAPDGEPLSAYFSTHPAFDVRIAALRKQLAKQSAPRETSGEEAEQRSDQG